MKRKLTLLFSLLLMITFAIPAQGFAAGMDKELENAIRTAKARFTIPEDYKFTSNISSVGNRKVYYLNWRSPDSENSININLGVDENGMILNYSKYASGDYIQTKKLPKLSRQDAKARADKYIEAIAPGLLKSLRYDDNGRSSVLDSSYSFNYCRVINGIPYYNDSVSVIVNRDTGELRDYMRNWSDIDAKASKVAPIPLKTAEAAYTKNMGMKLIYKYTDNDGILSAYQVYVPVYDNNGYGVDAFTGDRRRVLYGYDYGFNQASVTMAMDKVDRGAAVEEVKLSPEEMKAVQDASGLITREEAEKVARDTKFLNISEQHKLQSNYFGNSWPEKNEYTWSLYFTRQADEKESYAQDYVNVSVNARTGEITNFYRDVPITKSTKAKNSVEAAKTEMDAFLARYYPKYVKQLHYDKPANESNYGVSNTSFNFVYTRLVNDIPFPDNGVTITYDNVNGVITGFNLNWYNMDFRAEKVTGPETALEKLYRNVGLELVYRNEYKEETALKRSPENERNTQAILVYAFKTDKPLIVGASSGKLLNYNGTEYKEPAKVGYTDIKGHPAEKQILVLAENGVSLPGSRFNPNAVITQLDFLMLLSKTLNYYNTPVEPKGTDKETEELYAFMIKEGIVRAEERAPKKEMTREDAVRYLIRAMKYDKVADIKGIFNISFKDKADIDPNMAGYVAIAAGLNIVDGRNQTFKPKSKVTRADAAIMIYNYLQS